MAQHILDLLKERGFIAQMTFEDELYEQLKNPTTFYVGFDPTADSLHIGHYIPSWRWRTCSVRDTARLR